MYMSQTGIENVEQICAECGRVCDGRRSLGNHLGKSHPQIGGLKNYVLKHFLDGMVPGCECGCGGLVEWHETKYRFNSYITGHNKAGFRVSQPTFTREQIEKRNESIRFAYSNKRGEIIQKISSGVSDSLRASGKDFSKYFQEKWSNPEFQAAQHVARVKSWQGDEGQIRREKIFTPEFAKKIGLANMRRELTYTSKEEVLFSNRLRDIGVDIQTSKWFNFDQKVWNVDVWIPQTETMVEFDGIYWHGLDRDFDWKPEQIKNLTNDLKKNKMAKDLGLNLLRISSNVDLDSIQSLSDLESLSHHVVKNGVVLKEGSFKLSETTPLILRDRIIRIALQDEGKKYLEETIVPLLKDFLRAYVDYWGWFYPISDKSLQEVLMSLARGAHVLSSSAHGSDWLKSRVKSFWEVDRGPVKAFESDKILQSVLKYRLGLNNSKLYDYALLDGEKVQVHETFDVTLKDIRNGFIVQRNKVSWFKPSWAAYVYRRFLSGVDCPVVWDPSVGFSARMLGFSSVSSNGTYVGTDPCFHMCRDARDVASLIGSIKPRLSFEIHQDGSERWKPVQDSLDLVFTSPPYFDAEKYYDEPGQCWRDYPGLEGWKTGYYFPTLKNAFVGLKSGRHLVLNVSSKLRDVTFDCAAKAGFVFIEEIDMKLNGDHFSRSRGQKGSSECFLVFQKQHI